jgi:hypothetical protein
VGVSSTVSKSVITNMNIMLSNYSMPTNTALDKFCVYIVSSSRILLLLLL